MNTLTLDLFASVAGPPGGLADELGYEPDFSDLTEGQRVTALEVLGWLVQGAGRYKVGQAFRERCMATLTGCAGSGKTFSLAAILREAKLALPESFAPTEGEPLKVVGVAPTGQATRVMEAQGGGMYDECRTFASLLGLRPREVEISDEEDARLEYLESVPKEDLGDIDRVELDILTLRREDALKRVIRFLPSDKKGTVKRMADVRILVVDECSMVDSTTLGYLFQLIESGVFRPDLQILFVGDQNQIPPVDEILSKTFMLPAFTRLKKVERFAGALVNLSEEANSAPVLEGLLDRSAQQFLVPVDQLPQWEGVAYRPIEVVGAIDAAETMVDAIRAGETCRWICATRDEVYQANMLVQRLLRDGLSIDYAVGDELLSLSPIMIDLRYGSRRATGKDSKLICPNSEVMKIVDLSTGARVYSGNHEFRLLEARCTVADAPLDEPVILLHPDDRVAWDAECKRLAERAEAFGHTPKAKSRCASASAKDLRVMDLWEELGVSSWHGVDQKALRKRAWGEYYELKNCWDDVSLAWASTVHKAQGCGWSTVLFSAGPLLKSNRNRPNYGAGTTWDVRKLFYTAVTRVRNQLIAVV